MPNFNKTIASRILTLAGILTAGGSVYADDAAYQELDQRIRNLEQQMPASSSTFSVTGFAFTRIVHLLFG